MTERIWRVRLGAAAEVDFANILKWTTENFGARQSRVYRETLVQAIGELADGPDTVGSKARDEIMAGLRTLHIARRGRRGSHFLMYRAGSSSTIELCVSSTTERTFSAAFHLPPTRAPNRASGSIAAKACANSDMPACRSVGDAPRPMKMGTVASLSRYERALRSSAEPPRLKPRRGASVLR